MSIILLILLLLLLIIVATLYFVSFNDDMIHLKHAKVYPLCCEKCKDFAQMMLSEYISMSNTDLPVIKTTGHFTTKEKPVKNIKDSKGGYLVIKLEEYQPVNNSPENIEKIQPVIKHFADKSIENREIKQGDLGKTERGIVLVNLDIFHPK